MPNLFPDGNMDDIPMFDDTGRGVKFGRSWQFDFEKGEFRQTPTGVVAPADGLQAYVEWCNKALRTPRYRYLVYNRAYGSEFEDLFRRNLTRAGNESEIRRMVTETLIVSPRTAYVDNFRFVWFGEAVYVEFDVSTVRGDSATLELTVVTG